MRRSQIRAFRSKEAADWSAESPPYEASVFSIRGASKTINVGKPFRFTAAGGSGNCSRRTGNASVAAVGITGKVMGKTVGNTYSYCRDSHGNEARCLLKIKA